MLPAACNMLSLAGDDWGISSLLSPATGLTKKEKEPTHAQSLAIPKHIGSNNVHQDPRTESCRSVALSLLNITTPTSARSSPSSVDSLQELARFTCMDEKQRDADKHRAAEAHLPIQNG